MSGITTAMATSFKKELMLGVHHLAGTVTVTGNTSTAAGTPAGSTIGTLSSIAGISAGMTVSDTTNAGDIPANTYVSRILSGTSVNIDKIMLGTHTGDTLVFKGDSVAFALIKHTPTGTYDATTTNYSQVTGNSDEATGAGYVAGGFVWAPGAMITPATSGTGAFAQPSTNPSWSAATLNIDGGLLYSVTQPGNAIAIENLGQQQVTSGVLTLLLPTNGVGTSLLQVN